MDNLLTAVKTTKKVQSNINKFESLTLNDGTNRSRSNSSAKSTKPVIEVDAESEPVPLLTAISSRTTTGATQNQQTSAEPTVAPLQIVKEHKRKDSAIFLQKDYLKDTPPPSLADDAREILKSQPGIEDIEAVLSYLQYGIEGQHDFNVKVTSTKSSLLVRTLVTTTLPDLWPNLTMSKLGDGSKRMRKALLESLFSVAGIEAVLEQVRFHTRPGAITSQDMLGVYVDFLHHLLRNPDTVLQFLQDCTKLYEKEVQRRLFWQSIVSLLAGSKLLATLSAIPNTIAESGKELTIAHWLVNGECYSQWLANNIAKASIESSHQDLSAWSNLSQLFKRSLSLGYRDVLVTKLYTSLLLGSTALWPPLHRLITPLPQHDQKVVFDSILADSAKSHFAHSTHLPASTNDPNIVGAVAGAAALVHGLISHNEYLLEYAQDWVSSTAGQQTKSVYMKRALFTAMAKSNRNLERVLERCLASFSDKLLIQHMATAQQEQLAQTILIAIGYMNRQDPASLKQNPIALLTMQSVTNRLASSVPRTRLLGMTIGVAMSRCTDEPDKVMKFDVEEMETAEVRDMLALVDLKDEIGDIEQLKNTSHVEQAPWKQQPVSRNLPFRPAKVRKIEPTSKIMSIEEVSASSEDEDDLVPYQKPTDDPEDSEDDVTLINRDKPKAPIYIVDLIKQLQSASDKLDIISLAIKTAAGLIRRKTGFGTEVSDNIHSLASALINLRDGMSKPEHQQELLDALVACVVALPAIMGKHLAVTYLDGDFSMSQRSTLLIAIGLGAREVAGFDDSRLTQSQQQELDLFPSQRLPPHLQPKKPAKTNNKQPSRLIGMSNPIAMLTNAANQDTIRPMAVAAAQTQEGPEVLKVTRTSSRLQVSKEKILQQQNRSSKIPRDIYNILANNIFLPLASPLAAILQYTSSSAGRSIATTLIDPTILTLHLQTLTLLLHTLGPTGLSLPNIYSSIVHEVLTLLLALHHHKVVYDAIVLPATLGLFLALIDITTEIGVSAQERLLADPFEMQVSELVAWTSSLENSGVAPPSTKEDGRGGEGMAWTVLAAGIQVRWYEMGRKFQGRMLGLQMYD